MPKGDPKGYERAVDKAKGGEEARNTTTAAMRTQKRFSDEGEGSPSNRAFARQRGDELREIEAARGGRSKPSTKNMEKAKKIVSEAKRKAPGRKPRRDDATRKRPGK